MQGAGAWRGRELLLSAGQVPGASRRELPNRERACPMIALTRNFHVFASCVTTGFTAIFFPIQHITQARYVCALPGRSIRHHDPVLFKVSHPQSIVILDAALFALTDLRKLGLDSLVVRSGGPHHFHPLHAALQTHVAVGSDFQGFPAGSENRMKSRVSTGR